MLLFGLLVAHTFHIIRHHIFAQMLREFCKDFTMVSVTANFADFFSLAIT